jgi:hypothetical protein
MKSYNNYLDSIEESLKINLCFQPTFREMSGEWTYLSSDITKRQLAVITDKNELVQSGSDDLPLLGIYAHTKNEMILFPDVIKKTANEYSDNKSLVVENGRVIGDLRKTMGNALTGAPNGMHYDEAYLIVSTVCRIKLIIYTAMHSCFGEWESPFYNYNNRIFINDIADDLTKIIVGRDKKLAEFYELLLDHDKQDRKFEEFVKPIDWAKNLPAFKDNEWENISKMKDYLNNLPIDEKNTNQTWDVFLKTRQELLISQAKSIPTDKKPFHVIWPYLNEDQKNVNVYAYNGERYNA